VERATGQEQGVSATGVRMRWEAVRRAIRRTGDAFGPASLCAAMALGAVFGFLVLRIAPQIPVWSRYRLVLLGLVGLAFVGTLVVGDVRRVLLVALVLAIPLNLAFSPLGDVPYHAGGASPGVMVYPYDFPLVGLAIIRLLDALSGRRLGRFSGVDAAAISLIVWAALSVYNSTFVALSVFEIVRMAKLYLLMRVVAGAVETRRDMADALAALLIGLIVQGGIGLLQYGTGVDFGLGLFTVGELRRVSGTIGWPNTFGTYAATMVAIAFTLWVGGAGMRPKALVGVACLAGAVPLVLSFSRGAWFALLPALVVGVVLCWRQGWLGGRGVARLMVVGLSAVGAVALFGGSVVSRLAEMHLHMPVIVDRLKLNQVAANMIGAHPLLGIGINTFVDVMREYDTTGVTYYFPQPVHNVYLLVAAETGLVGLGLFLMLLLNTVWGALRAAGSKDRFVSVCATALLCGLVVLAASNLADDHLRTEVLYAHFWLLIGLVVAARRMVEEPAPAGPDPSPVGPMARLAVTSRVGQNLADSAATLVGAEEPGP